MATQTKNFLPLIGLVAVFAVPLAVAVFLNSTWSDWHPDSTKNFGRLIEPPAALPMLTGYTTEEAGPEQRRWTVMFVTRVCPSPCLDQLLLLRQIHRTLGRDTGRVRRILVAEGVLSESARRRVEAEMPEMLAIEGAGAAWFTSLGDALGEDPRERALIVDPRGAVVLSYPTPLNASGLRKDLTHLLKWSQ